MAIKIGNRPVDQRYAESIKRVRNRLRHFSHDSAIVAIANYLNPPPHDDTLKSMQRLPWVAERLAIWLLADSPYSYGNIPMTDIDVMDCINLAWDLMDRGIYLLPEQTKDTQLFIRQIFLSQAPYQTRLDIGLFGRQLDIVRRLAPNSNLRRTLEKKAGMSLELYFELAILFWSLSDHTEHTLRNSYIGSIANLYSHSAVANFFNKITLTKSDIHNRIKENRQLISADEWFQPTILYKFPFIKTKSALLSWGGPTIRRHFENVITDWLDAPEHHLLKQDWEKHFSNYIGDSLRRTKSNIIDEAKIKKIFALTEKQKVCDFLVEENDAVIFIEVKHKYLTENFPAIATPKTLQSKLKGTVVKGLDQLKQTLIHAESYNPFKNKEFYSLIITTGELWLGHGEYLHNQDLSDSLTRPYIICANDLDHLCELVRTKRTTFKAFIEDLIDKNSNPETSVFTPGMLLAKEPYALSQAPDHLRAMCEASLEAIKDHLLREQ